MLPRKIASRYAEALFDLAQHEGKTDAWERELATLGAVIASAADFREVLTHPEIPWRQKETVVTRAFQGKISPEVLALLLLLIRRGHDPDIDTVHDLFVKRWNTVRRLMPVTVTSAVPLTDTQASMLARVLATRTGATVQLRREIDPNLISGMVITMGDRVIDASALTAFQELKTAMTGG